MDSKRLKRAIESRGWTDLVIVNKVIFGVPEPDMTHCPVPIDVLRDAIYDIMTKKMVEAIVNVITKDPSILEKHGYKTPAN